MTELHIRYVGAHATVNHAPLPGDTVTIIPDQTATIGQVVSYGTNTYAVRLDYPDGTTHRTQLHHLQPPHNNPTTRNQDPTP